MPTSHPEREAADPAVAFARRVVRTTLEAALPEPRETEFDEDTLLYSVQRLKRDDPAWLLAILEDERYPPEARHSVLMYAASDLTALARAAASRAAKREPSQ
jgi:hypothetical protein